MKIFLHGYIREIRDKYQVWLCSDNTGEDADPIDLRIEKGTQITIMFLALQLVTHKTLKKWCWSVSESVSPS